jgi:hypothetical protein
VERGVTYYTISDSRYFVGTAAMLNSLRLTGNHGEVVVLDRGLEPGQRTRLERHARVVDIDDDRLGNPVMLKAYPQLLGADGTIVIIDSDMLVTEPLEPIVTQAAAGKVCLFPDHWSDYDRWFAEWETAFSLRAPLRRRRYLNSGFVALSTQHWPDLLSRWWEACAALPPDLVFAAEDSPFRDGDQDALNALLMSEVPEDAVGELPASGEAHPDALLDVQVLDAGNLVCAIDGNHVTILHASGRPKVWHAEGWRRVRARDAHTRLLPRVLLAADVPLRLDPTELPVWLRDGRKGSASVRGIEAAARAEAHVRRVGGAIKGRLTK